jgi:hypothetical protein
MGGTNLYGFVGNCVVNVWDMLGLDARSDCLNGAGTSPIEEEFVKTILSVRTSINSVSPVTITEVSRTELYSTSIPRVLGFGGTSITYYLVVDELAWTTEWNVKNLNKYNQYTYRRYWDEQACECKSYRRLYGSVTRWEYSTETVQNSNRETTVEAVVNSGSTL